VEASDERVKKLVDEFLQVEDTPGPRGNIERKDRPKRRKPTNPEAAGLEDATTYGREQAVAAIEQGLGKRLPVLFPRLRTKGSVYAGPPRVYRIFANGRTYPSYRMVINRAVGVGEYYGLQGTTWKDPPILEDASETRKIGGREYELHYDGDRLRLVAWHTDKGSYWVSNTLLQSLSEAQMMGIARSVRSL